MLNYCLHFRHCEASTCLCVLRHCSVNVLQMFTPFASDLSYMTSPISWYASDNCSPGDPARIVLIGDSFATRFEHYCRTHAIINGWLYSRLISLSVVGKGGRASWLVQGRRPADYVAVTLTPGDNDLNNCDCQPDQMAKDMLNVARSLIRVDGFQKVGKFQLPYRYPPSGSSMRSPLHGNTPFNPGATVWLMK